MNKAVYVVGTLHKYQGTYNVGLGATKDELEQFRLFLKEIVHKHGIRSIAKEMSVEALGKYPHPDLPSGESVPFQVAHELSTDELRIPHEYCCPPDLATRDKLGLSPGPMPDTPDDNEKREAYWLEQVEKLNSFPCLFVLGSAHSDSFPALLNTFHLEATLLIKEWKPSRNKPNSP
jgi:hypothetical protein